MVLSGSAGFQHLPWVSNRNSLLRLTLHFKPGENNYELARLEKRIFYVKFFYAKQYVLTRMSREVPDVVNAFGVLAKEDTSHGFPVARPLERNSDWALYNVNSEGWF